MIQKTNKIMEKVINSIIIAFVIALFTPSQASAHYGTYNYSWYGKYNYSWCWPTYKKTTWHKGHKGSWDKGSKGSKGSWDKGSKGSKGSWDCDYTYTGSVCGHVFKDVNKNSYYDKWKDTGLKGIKIKLTDSNSKVYYATTDKWGYYSAKNIKTGSVKVEIVKSSLPSGAKHVYGTDPTWIKVYKNCEAWAGRDGYTFGPKERPKGSICGHVFEDTNDNGKWDKWSDKALGNIKIEVTAENGAKLYGKTDKWGWYSVKNVPVGTASVKVITSTLPDPDNFELVVGTDPTPVTVEANDEAWEEHNGYIFTDPVGSIHGSVFYDKNRNGQKDAGEKAPAGISIKITDADGNNLTTQTDANGEYIKEGLAEGQATVEIVVTTLPKNTRLTVGINPSPVTVIADQNIDAGDDGYTSIPKERPKGSICGHVFEDTNENGKWDKGSDKELTNIKIEITAENGAKLYGTTDKWGWYSVKNVPVGIASVKVITSTLPDPDNFELVVGTDPTEVIVEANDKAWEEHNGYIFPNPVGSIKFFIFDDVNNNGKFDSEDKGIPNVSVTIVDVENNTHNLESDDIGKIMIDLPLGTLKVSVDDNDTDLINNNYVRTIGINVVTAENTEGVTAIQNHGFVIVHP